VEAFGQPEEFTGGDEKGHGTPVAGIATYGDLRNILANGEISPRFRLASARVVNKTGKFENKSLVPQQIEAAIRRLHALGARVINISLGDRTRPAGNKASAWAAVIDDLARELDLVIVVSAGNSDRNSLLRRHGDGIVTAYPAFFSDGSFRILEPATAINALTVGSLAHSNGLSAEDGDYVGVRAITEAEQPSPFTRIGPGIGGMIKPDLVDYGGTALFDGATQNLIDGKNRPAAGVLSLHNLYLQKLFTSVSGTSFAAPLVAYKAAAIREAFPEVSANFVRALLALSAEYPQKALDCLSYSKDAPLNTLGYGLPNLENALYSDDSRVILYREDSLQIDKFAIYEIPIPPVFQTTRGKRQISVSLAYDPPVRHTRLDYAGIEMSFELVRGVSEAEVFDNFRKWEKGEGDPFKVTGSKRCKMEPGSQKREKGSLQRGIFRAMTNLSAYGDRYFLAVRCEGGWASEDVPDQRFAVVVELRHEGTAELYQRVQERVRLRA
jgi:subtilisin family serine protease